MAEALAGLIMIIALTVIIMSGVKPLALAMGI